MRPPLATPPLFLPLFVAIACATTRTDDAPADRSAPVDATDPTASSYQPGGMWMPGQMALHTRALEALGLAYPVEDLTRPTAFPLGAVVSLGGCSASFVSDRGLIVTNHHCVTGALQGNARAGANLLEEGYLASSPVEEKWAGPTQRVYVTTAFRDVTDQVLEGLAAIESPGERYTAMEQRVKELTAACEAGKVDTRCRIASYYEGAEFHQIEQLEIRDVRLVYAPHPGIGIFGGEIDNWRWPRHTGDFAFLRAYVGKDGKPADHASDNVPFKPDHHLELASSPLGEGDLVMVAGYPGRTYRLKTAAEVEIATNLDYPHRIDMFQDYIKVLEEVGKDDEEIRIKAATRMRGLQNYLTNYRGMLDGLVKDGLAERKKALERDLLAHIEADPERKSRYDGVLDQMNRLHAEAAEHHAHDTAVGEILRGSQLLQAAITIAEFAAEREKPDAKRKPEYQERNWKRISQSALRLSSTYDATMDRAVFEMFVLRAARLPEGERPDRVLRLVAGMRASDPVTEDAVRRGVDRLYRTTELGSEKHRVKLVESATLKQVKGSKDPFLKLALALAEVRAEQRMADEAREGALAVLRPRYIAAMREFARTPLAPDANSTLRITFGTVRGYRPTPDAEPQVPFTTLSQLVDKHTGEEPFDAPARLVSLARAETRGPYTAESSGDVPVNFLADLDITGGNSGSATLNARGELVGLVFDGNYESIASDWLFMPEVTRSIHVDLRYMMWVMDAVDGADWLLEEMGATPVLEGPA